MTPEELPQAFHEQLSESRMAFRMPDGFSLVPAKPNDRVAYPCAIAMPAPKLEIRFHFVPLAPSPPPEGYTRIAGASMNSLHVPHLIALIHNVANRVITEPSLFPAEAVRAEFGAHWGAVCRLGLAPSQLIQRNFYVLTFAEPR